MCGRFTLTSPAEALAHFFGLVRPPEMPPRYNIAPTQNVATVLVMTGDRQVRLMRWGLIPSWAKDSTVASHMINARAETVAQKPAFRTALRNRRCLIIADGFYEWKHTGHTKQPFHIVKRDRTPFAFAGLWDRWQPPGGGEPIESCTIITTTANQVVAEFHERMPVILDPKDYDLWLDPAVREPDRLLPLLTQLPADQMEAYPVANVVNSPAHEVADCIKPLATQEQ